MSKLTIKMNDSHSNPKEAERGLKLAKQDKYSFYGAYPRESPYVESVHDEDIFYHDDISFNWSKEYFGVWNMDRGVKKPNVESAHDVFVKASKVIRSCQTHEQLRVALNYKLMAVSHILKIAPNRVYEYSVFLDEVMNKATTKVMTHGI